jgi:hypothetical protein
VKCHYPALLFCHITCAKGQGAEPNALVPSGRGAGEITDMKLLSASVLWLQALLFALGTVYVISTFNQVVRSGGGLVPGFESIELRRLIASLVSVAKLVDFELGQVSYGDLIGITVLWCG